MRDLRDIAPGGWVKVRLRPGALVPVGGADEGVDGTERTPPETVAMLPADAERFVAAGLASYLEPRPLQPRRPVEKA